MRKIKIAQIGTSRYSHGSVIFDKIKFTKAGEYTVSVTEVIPADSDKAAGITYKHLNKRMIGGFSGGTLPNSMSLTRFRSIAGCCAGFAPIGLWRAWTVSVEETDTRVTVNIPLNKEVKE